MINPRRDDGGARANYFQKMNNELEWSRVNTHKMQQEQQQQQQQQQLRGCHLGVAADHYPQVDNLFVLQGAYERAQPARAAHDVSGRVHANTAVVGCDG